MKKKKKKSNTFLSKIKNKNIIIYGLVLLVLIILAIIGKNFNNLNKNNLCKQIENYQSKKEDFVLLIEKPGTISSDNNEIMNKLKKNYKELNILHTIHSSINKECIDNLLKETGTKSLLKDYGAGILYKNGKYVGMITDTENYNNFEDYLSKNKLIKKAEIKEQISLNDFKSKIKDNYIIFLVDSEQGRTSMKNKTTHHFQEYKYDIVNINSDIGAKIYKYMLDNYKISLVMPQGSYFKNSKLLANVDLLNEDSEIVKLKDIIEKQ